MRSSVGWLCFGIVVLCVVDVKSRVAGNSQIIHARGLGYPGQMFERLIPTIGYRNVVPANSPRRIEARHYTDPDDPDHDNYPHELERNEEDDNDEMDNNNHPQKRKPSSGISQIAYNEHKRKQQHNEDILEEEENAEDDMEEHMASNTADNYETVGEKMEGDDEDEMEEMEYRSNKVYLNIPAHATYPKRSQSKIRYSPRNYPSKENLRRSNQKTKSVKRKKPSQISDEDYYQSNFYQKVNIAQKRNENYKQQLNLRPITKSPSNQFVATPIADLILRLSISLARPIGNGNGTASFFNIPIRLSNNGIEENSSALNATTSKVGSEIQEGNKLIDVAVPHSVNAEISENHEINDKEDDDDKDQEST